MSRGHVTWFSESLGYGFIETRSGDRVLVRSGAVEPVADHPREIQEGLEVEFSLGLGEDGVVEARHVHPI